MSGYSELLEAGQPVDGRVVVLQKLEDRVEVPETTG